MYGPPPMGFRGQKQRDKLREPKPQSIREVPDYLRRVVTKFCSRLLYIFRLVWETNRFILLAMLFVALFNGVMPIFSAYVSADVLNALADAFYGKVAFTRILWLIVAQFGIQLATQLISNLNNVVTRVSSELVTNHIKAKIMEKSKEVDLSSYDLPDFYEKLENANREASIRPMQVISSTLNIMTAIISMVSFIAVLAAVSPFAPWIVIAISIPSAVINFMYRAKNVQFMKSHSKERRQMQYYSEQVTDKDTVKEMRIFKLSDLFISRYTKVFREYFGGMKRLIVSENLWLIVILIFQAAVNCGFFLYITKMVCDGQFQVGSFSLYTGALTTISSAVSSLIATTSSVYEGTLFIDNMISFMNYKKQIVPLCPASPRHVAHHTGHTVRFENVSFSYPGSSRRVLDNISFTLEAGDTCVLVGLNGAGKTTLIKLLTRLYDPTEGRILLDGYDIREYDVDDLYSMFGIIFQDFGKYAFSVKENIRFGQLDKPDRQEDVEEAARQSSADAFIERLPDNYNTPLMRYFEENGTELSVGQWQKLAIARAFYSDSDVIILDEPTASLDAIAEQEIYNQFDALRRDKTTVFVSHRLSSATTANKIIVLENGKIVEMGDHTTLMHNRGHYYTLFSTQASRYLSEDADINSMVMETRRKQTAPDGAPSPLPPRMPSDFPQGEHALHHPDAPNPPNDPNRKDGIR